MKQPVTIHDFSITQSQLALFVMAKEDSKSSEEISNETLVKLQVELSPVFKPTILRDPASYHERSRTRHRNPFSLDRFMEYRTFSDQPDFCELPFCN